MNLEDLHDEIRKTYKDNTQATHMLRVAYWSGICEDESCLSKVSNFYTFRYFTFIRKCEYSGGKTFNLFSVQLVFGQLQ